MKKIEAIIKPSKLEAVRDALADLGINGITVSEVAGCGLRHGVYDLGFSGRRTPDYHPKVKVEIVVASALSGPAVSAIVEAARTGSVNDGTVFIFPVEEAIRIHTGETNHVPLC